MSFWNRSEDSLILSTHNAVPFAWVRLYPHGGLIAGRRLTPEAIHATLSQLGAAHIADAMQAENSLIAAEEQTVPDLALLIKDPQVSLDAHCRALFVLESIARGCLGESAARVQLEQLAKEEQLDVATRTLAHQSLVRLRLADDQRAATTRFASSAPARWPPVTRREF